MTEPMIDTSNAAKKIRRTLRQDGLDYIVGGVGLALVAIFFLDIRHGWAYVVAVGLHASLLPYLRRRIVYPRIGYAKLPPMKMTIVHHLLVIIGVAIALILFYIFGKDSRFNWIMPLYAGCILSFMSFVVAVRYRLKIDYVLASFFLVSGIIGSILTRAGNPAGIVTAVQLWILAGILIPVGLVQFLLFVHRYPHAKEQIDESSV